MYRLVTEIPNDQAKSYITDVAFHPGGGLYAVVYRDLNQIRLYDAATHTLVRSYRNPQAGLDWPHGAVMTERHLIVSNKHNPMNRPSVLNVYRLDDSSDAPAAVFPTPVKNLRLAHSLAVCGGIVLATYYGKGIRALVSYRFDDETGTLTGPVDLVDGWFGEHGNPKGVCLNREGTKALVSVVSEKPPDYRYKIRRFVRLFREERGMQRFLRLLGSKLKKKNKAASPVNGLAVFDVGQDGALSKTPSRVLSEPEFCRLENISIAGEVCAVSDAVNNAVKLYRLDEACFPGVPVQVITEGLFFPHDACLSPDNKLLVVANYGLEILNGSPQWDQFLEPRQDKLSIYQRPN
ncbi:MAG: hypothetical protein ACU833_13820 [Gammaproteobacteria bacterium]